MGGRTILYTGKGGVGKTSVAAATAPRCAAAGLRGAATPELRDRWSSLQRELLPTLRALIDSHLEQAEQPERGSGPRVEDISIE